jgi:hypothetical protein
MKRVLTLLALMIFFSTGFSVSLGGGSVVDNEKLIEHDTTPMAMNATPTPIGEDIKEGNIPKIDQPKQPEQMVGSNSSTWTPAYLSVKKFNKCLKSQKYRGWQGYCLPKQQPKNCPDESWQELTQMNLIPCSNTDK